MDFQLASRVREQMVPCSYLVRQQCCIFTAQGPAACLPLGCFISANLAAASTLGALANPSTPQTVCVTLQSPVQPNGLLCCTPEACQQYVVQACIMQQLKKKICFWTLIAAAVNYQTAQKPQAVPQYRYWPSLYVSLQDNFLDLFDKPKLYLFDI